MGVSGQLHPRLFTTEEKAGIHWIECWMSSRFDLHPLKKRELQGE